MGIVISRIDDMYSYLWLRWKKAYQKGYNLEYMTWLLLPCTIEKTIVIGIAISRIHDMTITAMYYWENVVMGIAISQ